MSFVAEAARTADGDVSVVDAFARLRDFSAWRSFMPRSFAPVRGPDRPFAVGDAFWVRIAGAPFATKLRVVEITTDDDRDLALGWTGGPRGLLSAVHRFVFEREGKRVLSVETWTGALSPLAKPFVKPIAERIGREQLAGLLTRAS